MKAHKQVPGANIGGGLLERNPNRRSHTRPARQRKWDRQQRILLNLRDTLLERIHSFASEAREEHPSYSLHPADAATDSYDRDIALGMATFDQEILYEVDSALQRLKDGTYGICERTGERIPYERLLAVPWTRYLSEVEAFNDEPHPHLGQRGSIGETEDANDNAGEALSTLPIDGEPWNQAAQTDSGA